MNDTAGGGSPAQFLPASLDLWSGVVEGVRRHVDFLLSPHSSASAFDERARRIFFVNWSVQFVASWIAFGIYMVWDYRNHLSKTLEQKKLPTRHPLVPFWHSQLRMIPLVLYNQCVVWPLVNMALVWPQWSLRMGDGGFTEWGWSTVPCLLALMLVSDQMWYWSHRFMHTPYAWKHWHKMHHVAEQTAISATYVHPVEYAMFTVAMNLPFALTGFPVLVHAVPMGWGMFTGSGAHSGYSGDFANGDKHNGHHYFHNVNFGLLMIADSMFGTHWNPGDPPPRVWSEAEKIWDAFPDVHGTEAASATKEYAVVAAMDSEAAEAAVAKKRVGADTDMADDASAEARRLLDAKRRGRRALEATGGGDGGHIKAA